MAADLVFKVLRVRASRVAVAPAVLQVRVLLYPTCRWSIEADSSPLVVCILKEDYGATTAAVGDRISLVVGSATAGVIPVNGLVVVD